MNLWSSGFGCWIGVSRPDSGVPAVGSFFCPQQHFRKRVNSASETTATEE